MFVLVVGLLLCFCVVIGYVCCGDVLLTCMLIVFDRDSESSIYRFVVAGYDFRY